MMRAYVWWRIETRVLCPELGWRFRRRVKAVSASDALLKVRLPGGPLARSHVRARRWKRAETAKKKKGT